MVTGPRIQHGESGWGKGGGGSTLYGNNTYMVCYDLIKGYILDFSLIL